MNQNQITYFLICLAYLQKIISGKYTKVKYLNYFLLDKLKFFK